MDLGGKDNNMEKAFQRLARGIKMILDAMKIKPIDNVIAELNTQNTFVKVKGNSFHIGKTLFSFVEFDAHTKKLQKSVDCYMGLEESLIFCQDALSGKLLSRRQRSAICALTVKRFPVALTSRRAQRRISL